MLVACMDSYDGKPKSQGVHFLAEHANFSKSTGGNCLAGIANFYRICESSIPQFVEVLFSVIRTFFFFSPNKLPPTFRVK